MTMPNDLIADLVVRTARSREEVVEVFDERAREEAERRAFGAVIAVLGEAVGAMIEESR